MSVVVPGRCWVAEMLPGAGPCDGVLVRAHLIPKQRIKREVLSRTRSTAMTQQAEYELLWDPRVWVPMCGGPTGIGGHHGQVDGRQLRIPHELLPEEVREFAREWGLEWSLLRDYAPASKPGDREADRAADRYERWMRGNMP